jgi:glycosyltransferase involved in cell wall biosynthesis
VPVARLVSVIAGADVGVLPIEANNESKRHSLANKLFEYLMAGLPVLATDLPEHRRVLEGTGAGVLVPAATAEHLERGALELLEAEARHPGRAREVALRLAHERHNLEADAPALLGLVTRCLAAPAG